VKSEVEHLREENERLRAELSRVAASASSSRDDLEEELRTLLEGVPIALFVIDPLGRFDRYRSGRMRLAASPESFLGRTIADIFVAPLAEQFEGAVEGARTLGERSTVEYDLPHLGHYMAHFAPLSGARVAVLVADITEQFQAQAALATNERRFRALIDKATDVLYVVDAGFIIRFWSPGAAEALGWTADEAVGTFGLDFIHPDDVASIPPPDPSLPPGSAQRFTYRVRHRDGTWRTLEAVVRNHLADPTIAGIIVNARDVTEQRRLEMRSAESQKLESIGRLAGGVAHDFNNLLTVILGCGELLQESVAARAPAPGEFVDEIIGAANRARDLTRQLLAFARRQVIAPIVLDLNTQVLESERLLARLLGEDITLRVELAGHPCRVRCDPAQLHQVIVNLAVNARDAMPRGGRLHISTGRVVPRLPTGDQVRLIVADDGPGMSPEVRAHAFEPFFTTKPTGKGTGLGLATVYGIIRQSGGQISVDCPAGGGTVFEILLPNVDTPEPAVLEPEAHAVPAPRGRGRHHILLVEDEPSVSQVVARMLEQAGYIVLHASNGARAVEMAREAEQLDLLLTDVVMPGMDGRQVADAVAGLWPGLPVLFMSGYTQDAIVQHGVVEAGVEFLPKPFTSAVLIRRVQAMLAAAGARRTPR
jgi:PAS domain S-box-containing protein